LPGHPARAPRPDLVDRLHLLGARSLAHEEHAPAVPLVDGARVLHRDDHLRSREVHVAVPALADVIADDELALPLVREAAELTIAPVSAVARLHVIHLDA